eukprot:TRINITY_DN563_c1_g1_i2.p1 TRINITY_DN563_c1_g1~~TRINITY_DN563_c1_g1_i2.p1  ORF type:complete len:330 (-),score=104.71 TRINITY_DN563_c1_g1_i2:180-1169(-)
MWDNDKAPYRLILNGGASKEIEWHCEHYVSRNLMKRMSSGADLAREMGISAAQLEKSFGLYNEAARTKKCPHGKRFFTNAPFNMDDYFHVAVVTPLVHYCMGGLVIDHTTAVMRADGKGVIEGLYAAGEVTGGVHGINRLGGNGLLEAVVFGRVAGVAATRGLLLELSSGSVSSSGGDGPFRVDVDPASKQVTISWGGESNATTTASATNTSAPTAGNSAAAAAAMAEGSPTSGSGGGDGGDSSDKEYTWDEIKKHTTEGDCWVVVAGRVLDVTNFLPDHPGGKKAILTWGGKDATKEFDTFHERGVIDKYAPECVIGTVKEGGAKARL